MIRGDRLQQLLSRHDKNYLRSPTIGHRRWRMNKTSATPGKRCSKNRFFTFPVPCRVRRTAAVQEPPFQKHCPSFVKNLWGKNFFSSIFKATVVVKLFVSIISRTVNCPRRSATDGFRSTDSCDGTSIVEKCTPIHPCAQHKINIVIVRWVRILSNFFFLLP